MQYICLPVQGHHLLYAHGTAFVKSSFSKGKARVGQFPFCLKIIPGARGSWVSFTKPLLFVSSLVKRNDNPCSVPSFGLIPADGCHPWPDRRAQRWCRQRFPCHSRPQEYNRPAGSVPSLTCRLQTHGLHRLCSMQGFFCLLWRLFICWWGIILSEARVNRFHTETSVGALSSIKNKLRVTPVKPFHLACQIKSNMNFQCHYYCINFNE